MKTLYWTSVSYNGKNIGMAIVEIDGEPSESSEFKAHQRVVELGKLQPIKDDPELDILAFPVVASVCQQEGREQGRWYGRQELDKLNALLVDYDDETDQMLRKIVNNDVQKGLGGYANTDED